MTARTGYCWWLLAMGAAMCAALALLAGCATDGRELWELFGR
jgi:hypothetical protein